MVVQCPFTGPGGRRRCGYYALASMTKTPIAPVEALTAFGLGDCPVSFLASGLSCDAWLVTAPQGQLVLRVAKDAGAVHTLAREHAVLAALSAQGAPVPAPVAGSWQQNGWTGPPCSVTRFVPGRVAAPADVPGLARDVAGFLRVLHATPAPPGTPSLADRFAAAPIWPLTGSRPLRASRTLVVRLDALADDVRDAMAGPQSLVHSDLHEGNIVCTEHGAAFLDFECAFVGSPLWDFAALAFFCGWPVADRVLNDYGSPPPARAARLVALPFTLYRWDTAGEGAQEAAHAEAFLRETVDAL